MPKMYESKEEWVNAEGILLRLVYVKKDGSRIVYGKKETEGLTLRPPEESPNAAK